MKGLSIFYTELYRHSYSQSHLNFFFFPAAEARKTVSVIRRLSESPKKNLVSSIPKEDFAYAGSASVSTPQLLPVISLTIDTAWFWCDVMLMNQSSKVR